MIVVFVLLTRRAPVNSIRWLIDDKVLDKRRLLLIIAYSGTLFLYVCGDYMRTQRKTIGLIVNVLIS